MKNDDALKIIEALANGVNPETGAVFVDDSPFQTANITDALFAAAKALKYKISAENRRKNLPVNAGEKWTDQETNEVSIVFDKGQSVTEIAKFHGRTRGSIQSRLVKLGKIPIPPPNFDTADDIEVLIFFCRLGRHCLVVGSFYFPEDILQFTPCLKSVAINSLD